MGVRARHELRLTEAGKLTQNANVGCFSGRFRDEYLNEHRFGSLVKARAIVAAWRVDYNLHRPHSSLGQLTPREYLRRSGIEGKEAANF